MNLDEERAINDLARALAPSTEGILTEIHLGTIVSEQSDGTCTVWIGGDEPDEGEDPIDGVRKLDTPTPPGTVCYIGRSGGDYTIIGVLALEPANTWTDFACVISQPGALAHTPTYSKYLDDGKTRKVRVETVMSAAGTAANTLIATLPPGAPADATLNDVVGFGQVNQGANGVYLVGVRLHAVTATPSVNFLRGDINNSTGAFGVDPSAGIAVGNPVRFICEYELA